MVYVQLTVPDTIVLYPNRDDPKYAGFEPVMLKGLRNEHGHASPYGKSAEVPFTEDAALAFSKELEYFESRGQLKIRVDEDKAPAKKAK